MKKPHLLLAALLILLVIVLVAVMSGMENETPAAADSRPSGTTASATASPKPTQNTDIVMMYDCTIDGEETTLFSLKEVWANQGAGCLAEQSAGNPNPRQVKALEAAYGAGTRNYDRLAELYQLCASTTGPQATGVFADLDAKNEMFAAYTLCVEHPNKDIFDKIVADEAAAAEKYQADKDAEKKAYADGLKVDDGNYLVGKDVQPGTWQSQGTKVTECYWEVSDAQGNIIANNFVNVAPQFTITVPAGAAGFTVSGCSFERIGD